MRTRLKLRSCGSGWLPRSNECKLLRYYMKRISCKARRANDAAILQEELYS